MTINTPFEEGLDETLHRLYTAGWVNGRMDRGDEAREKDTTNVSKATLTQLHEAAILNELEKLKQFQYPTGTGANGGNTYAVSILYIDSRIAALKSKEKE